MDNTCRGACGRGHSIKKTIPKSILSNSVLRRGILSNNHIIIGACNAEGNIRPNSYAPQNFALPVLQYHLTFHEKDESNKPQN